MGQNESKNTDLINYEAIQSKVSRKRLPAQQCALEDDVKQFDNLHQRQRQEFKRQKSEGHIRGKENFNLFRTLSLKGLPLNEDKPLLPCYHGWIRKTKVDQLLKKGPDGLYLVKNSTEFPGDLTLCVWQGRVQYFRILKQGNNKFTIDHRKHFQNLQDLLEEYKRRDTLGVLLTMPCVQEGGAAAGGFNQELSLPNTKPGKMSRKPREGTVLNPLSPLFQGPQRKARLGQKKFNVEDILIFNKDT